jgi:hypothetical protein
LRDLARWLRHEPGETPCLRKRIDDVRCPAVKDLRDDIYHILHHSFVEILKMRRSIESADAHIDTSKKAVIDAEAHTGRRFLNTPHLSSRCLSGAMPLHREVCPRSASSSPCSPIRAKEERA